MKHIFLTVVAMLAATLFLAVMPTEAEAAVYDDTIRLHVLANSDRREDQELKLLLRDALLSEYGERLTSLGSKEEAAEEISLLLSEISEFAEKTVSDAGYCYKVSASLGEEWYDTREYEDFTLPKGVYTSLRIVIGNGKGQNWWCVMYPPLCLDAATVDAPRDDGVISYSDAEIRLIKGAKYNPKFKLLELICGILS